MSDTKNQDTTRIKVNYKGDIRRVAITSKEVDDFSKLLSRLEAVCEAQKTGIKIRYIDEDDDEVTILTSGEFKEALDWAKSEGRTLRLDISELKRAPTKPKETKVSPRFESKEKKAKEEKKDPSQPKFEPPTSDFVDNAVGLLSDEKVITALREALPIAAEQLVGGEKVSTVLEVVLATQPALNDHPTFEKIGPMAQAYAQFIPHEIANPVCLDIVLELQSLLNQGKLQSMGRQALVDRFKFLARRRLRGLGVSSTTDSQQSSNPNPKPQPNPFDLLSAFMGGGRGTQSGMGAGFNPEALAQLASHPLAQMFMQKLASGNFPANFGGGFGNHGQRQGGMFGVAQGSGQPQPGSPQAGAPSVSATAPDHKSHSPSGSPQASKPAAAPVQKGDVQAPKPAAVPVQKSDVDMDEKVPTTASNAPAAKNGAEEKIE